MIDFTNDFRLIGENLSPGIGDVKIDINTGKLCIWVDDEWIDVGYPVKSEEVKHEFKKIRIPTNCINCGAPTPADGICEYCGTDNKRGC